MRILGCSISSALLLRPESLPPVYRRKKGCPADMYEHISTCLRQPFSIHLYESPYPASPASGTFAVKNPCLLPPIWQKHIYAASCERRPDPRPVPPPSLRSARPARQRRDPHQPRPGGCTMPSGRRNPALLLLLPAALLWHTAPPAADP